ncbi:MAG: hypothetical protein R3B84_20495 [Zavarzinella sp.]
MKKLILFIILSSAFPGMANANNFWNEFARGFAEAEEKNAKYRDAKRFERELQQETYDEVSNYLHQKQNLEYQQKFQKLNSQVQPLLQVDVPKCKPELLKKSNAQATIGCITRAMLKRYKAGDYDYMQILQDHVRRVTAAGKAFSSGKISEEEFNLRIARSIEEWQRKEQHSFTTYKNSIDNAIHEIAYQQSIVQTAGSRERYLQHRNMQELEERVARAERKANQAMMDAQRAESRAYDAERRAKSIR